MSVLTVSPQRRVLADLVPGALVRDIALVLGGAALTGLAAQIAVPIPGSPVPVTAQTFAALLVGATLGWQRGALSMLVYLLAGLAGVPWHTSAGSATIGYIVGFVLAGALVGALAQRGGDRTPLRTAGTMLLGNAVIYAVGVPWLMLAADFTVSEALVKGLLPFLIGDLVKTALAAGLLPAAWALVGRRDS
ncbi:MULTISPECIES: biotin transporter BioY [Crossiella]|uniref:Biotin transporter n=1 Tax=Crossiella cryophila TaxID=43355 RepID=A0A7W7CJJ2_9PSEU|nr:MULTISPECIES: biotin transporter BioY [Crossiella]MBB4682394.1 biotin transport system substrate-specific component [Crossiella cryophila]MCK2245323.1 biotin transporter BioY [Crossiella sp. S99.2]MCK2258975.1 biotin transporter BioY [Crossiella sp. S99.1]